jgi:30S ribosomal protein S31
MQSLYIKGVNAISQQWIPRSDHTSNQLIILNQKEEYSMGKGDKRTKRGKISRGTHGVSRPKKKAKKKR